MMFNETNCVEDFVELCADVIVWAIVIAADCVTETFEKRVIQACVISHVYDGYVSTCKPPTVARTLVRAAPRVLPGC